jgi:hypothetical protein
MIVREARRAPEVPIKKPVPAEVFTVAAAVKGVSSAQSIGRSADGYAQIIENGYATQTGVKPRGGNRKHATTGTRAVVSLMRYESGTLLKMFAAANGGLYDVTQPANPSTVITPLVTGLAGNDWSFVNFSTPGGQFMLAVNGADPHRTYDGAAFAANTPAITGISSALFSHVFVYANRVWFVEKDTLNVWYLPVDSIGGAATKFSLAGIFSKGGSLAFGATWSVEAGDGPAQRVVFVSTKGEAAVYQGTDPSSSATWFKVGVPDISDPTGRHGHLNIGGELEIATANGIVPLSQAVARDPATLSLAAITRQISPDWKREIRAYNGRNWSFTKWDEGNLAYVGPAMTYTLVAGTDTVDAVPFCHVVNLENGAWSKYTGWDIQCSISFNKRMYFGSANGRVYEAEATGADDGAAYVFKYCEWPNDFGGPETKDFLQIRTAFVHRTPFNPEISMSVGHTIEWPVAPAAAADVQGGGVWDTGELWDMGDLWDSTGEAQTEALWRSLGVTGDKGAPMVQMTFSNIIAPDVEIVKSDVAFRRGAIVT